MTHRDQLYLTTAVTHFKHDDQLMLLVNERLKEELGPSAKRRRIGDRDELVTLSVALERRGHSPNAVAKKRQRIGIAVSRKYRELYGCAPKKTDQNVHGRTCQVCCYSKAELEELLPVAEAIL